MGISIASVLTAAGLVAMLSFVIGTVAQKLHQYISRRGMLVLFGQFCRLCDFIGSRRGAMGASTPTFKIKIL